MVCDAKNKFNIDNGRLFLLLASLTIFVFSACANQATSESRADSNTAKPTATPTEAVKPSPTAAPLRNANTASQSENENGRRERIAFGKGKTSATIRGATPPASFDRYTIAARAGQEMTVQISAKDETVKFDIYAPGFNDTNSSSENMKKVLTGDGEEGKRSWQGKLPQDGNYEIEVGSRYGGSKYMLKVTVR